MNLKYFILLTALVLCPACSSNKNDPELEGNWVRENPTNRTDSFIFKGNHFGTNGNILHSLLGLTQRKVEYAVDKSEEPFKLYLIMQLVNRNAKVPFGIYKINDNDLTFCYVEPKQKKLYGKPVGHIEYKFPKHFSGNCLSFKKSI